MNKILIGYPLDRHEIFKEILKPIKKKYETILKDYTYSWILNNIHSFEILVPSIKVKIDNKIMERARNLRFIFTPTTGSDHLSFDREKYTIKVLSLIDFKEEIYSITSTAELAFSLVLILSRKIFFAHKNIIQDGKWERNNFLGKELQAKTLGIMGLGRIGGAAARYASAFGMKVIYWDKEEKKTDYEYIKNLTNLLSTSDYIICCLNLTPYTEHIINFSNIKNIKKGAIFVNISRGKIVDELALCYSLEKGILSGIGSDVLEEELVDFTSSPLYIYAKKHPEANIIITPHIGGATFEAWERVFSLIGRKILKRERLK